MTATLLNFEASCKLMLFGEYLVLEGAKSLAFPLKFGQSLQIEPSREIRWTSESPDGIWFTADFDSTLNIINTNNEEVANILAKLLKLIKSLKPDLNINNVFHAQADFNLAWGLGSSSTLISLLSQWSKIDPFLLLSESFGGSGYDIACATAKRPIIFQKSANKNSWKEISLNQNVTDHFLFIYLGQKQNSRSEIQRFKKSKVNSAHINEMNNLVDQSINCENIEEFESLLNQSEELLSPIIGKQKLKEHIFADYEYSIKSLGAWGGDFFLATHRNIDEAKKYFTNRGLTTMFTYKEMVK